MAFSLFRHPETLWPRNQRSKRSDSGAFTGAAAAKTNTPRVAGFDVAREPHEVRPRINMVSGGETSGYGLLTVRENLWMFGQFSGLDSRETNARIRELLDIVKMSDRMNTKAAELSTGLRQKMNIVRGFLTDGRLR